RGQIVSGIVSSTTQDDYACAPSVISRHTKGLVEPMSTETGAGRISTSPAPDIGLSAANTQGVTAILSRLLADEHVLYLRLRNYHWNLVGMAFGPLHALFQQQYEALAGEIDDIAERIRML